MHGTFQRRILHGEQWNRLQDDAKRHQDGVRRDQDIAKRQLPPELTGPITITVVRTRTQEQSTTRPATSTSSSATIPTTTVTTTIAVTTTPRTTSSSSSAVTSTSVTPPSSQTSSTTPSETETGVGLVGGSSQPGSLPQGAVIGIVIGCIFILLGTIAYGVRRRYVRRRMRLRKEWATSNPRASYVPNDAGGFDRITKDKNDTPVSLGLFSSSLGLKSGATASPVRNDQSGAQAQDRARAQIQNEDSYFQNSFYQQKLVRKTSATEMPMATARTSVEMANRAGAPPLSVPLPPSLMSPPPTSYGNEIQAGTPISPPPLGASSSSQSKRTTARTPGQSTYYSNYDSNSAPPSAKNLLSNASPNYGPPSMASLSPFASKVVSSFITTLPDELSITVGETVRVLAEYDDGWALCLNGRGEQGMIPLECLDRGFTSTGAVDNANRAAGGKLKRVSSLQPNINLMRRF